MALNADIRRATAGDLATLTALAAAAFGSSAWGPTAFAACLAQPTDVVLLAAPPHRHPVGFAVARIVADEIEVQSLAVAVSARGHGWGHALMGTVLEAGRESGARHAFLEVREGNRPARDFYLGCGFTDTARRAGYYREPDEAAIIMARAL